MEFSIGDRIKYISENGAGTYILGEIVDIWNNTLEIITGYFVTLDSGEYIYIQPNSLKWQRLEKY